MEDVETMISGMVSCTYTPSVRVYPITARNNFLT